jgi:hypothetical protein
MNRFTDMNGNFIIPRGFDYTNEILSDDYPFGWIDFFWNNLPADRKLLRKLKRDKREFKQNLRDFGFKVEYDVDQNGNVYALNPNIEDNSQSKWMIKHVLEQLEFTNSKIQMIQRQLPRRSRSPKRKSKRKSKSRR